MVTSKKKIEHWGFTQSELKKPSALKSDDELIATLWEEIESHELEPMDEKVVVYRNGKCANRWDDGTVGVSKDQCQEAEDDESPYNPKEGEEVAEWHDVYVDDNGNFLGFAPEKRTKRKI